MHLSQFISVQTITKKIFLRHFFKILESIFIDFYANSRYEQCLIGVSKTKLKRNHAIQDFIHDIHNNKSLQCKSLVRKGTGFLSACYSPCISIVTLIFPQDNNKVLLQLICQVLKLLMDNRLFTLSSIRHR